MQWLRKINDEVCAEHHLSVLTPYENGQTRKGNVLDKPNLLSVPSRTGVLLAGSAGLISTMGVGNDGKTPEEREAEGKTPSAYTPTLFLR